MKIEAKRQGEPCVPLFFIRELKAIDSDLSPFWDAKSQRLLIVKPAPAEVLRKRSAHIYGGRYIAELTVSKDNQFRPLDRRTLSEIKELLYDKNKLRGMGQHLDEMEEDDESLSVDAEKAWQIAKREFMKKLYRFQHTTTFT